MTKPNLTIQPTRLGKLTVIDTTSNRPRMAILGTFEHNEYGNPTFVKQRRVKLSEAQESAICYLQEEVDYV